MTQEEKDLLLKDLCARLPYGLKYNYGGYDGRDYIMNQIDCKVVDCAFPIENVKPYLFPLSSMTEEQQINLTKFVANGINGENILYDWYNKNHFDYRGLIPMGLAIDATGLNIY